MTREGSDESLLAASWSLLRRGGQSAIVGFILVAGLYGAVDLFVEPRQVIRAQGFVGLGSLYVQLLVTATMLGRAGVDGFRFDPSAPTRGRFPAAFGLSILWYLGVGAGVVLLVVPGVVLMVRWALVYPILLVENAGIIESFRRSWTLTRTSWKQCVLAYLLPLPLFLTGSVATIFYPEFEQPTLPLVLVANLFLTAALFLTWALIAAVYRSARSKEKIAQSRVSEAYAEA